MTNYFMVTIYILSILAIFIVPLHLNINRSKVVTLSLLPSFLVASTTSIAMLFSYFFDNKSLGEVISFSIFLFFEFSIFGYIMMFPILILIAFIIEYLRVYYRYSLIVLILIGGTLGAILSIIYINWKFALIAFISGGIAVFVQYYFTEYKIK